MAHLNRQTMLVHLAERRSILTAEGQLISPAVGPDGTVVVPEHLVPQDHEVTDDPEKLQEALKANRHRQLDLEAEEEKIVRKLKGLPEKAAPKQPDRTSQSQESPVVLGPGNRPIPQSGQEATEEAEGGADESTTGEVVAAPQGGQESPPADTAEEKPEEKPKAPARPEPKKVIEKATEKPK